MSRDALQQRLSLYTATAAPSRPSLASKNVTPHVLRHSAAMALLHAGVDITVIALWLGHESVTTTQIYLNFRKLHQTGEGPGDLRRLAA